jgi:hypothetical protein
VCGVRRLLCGRTRDEGGERHPCGHAVEPAGGVGERRDPRPPGRRRSDRRRGTGAAGESRARAEHRELPPGGSGGCAPIHDAGVQRPREPGALSALAGAGPRAHTSPGARACAHPGRAAHATTGGPGQSRSRAQPRIIRERRRTFDAFGRRRRFIRQLGLKRVYGVDPQLGVKPAYGVDRGARMRTAAALALALLVAATLGYVVGHHASAGVPREQVRSAFVAGVQLSYPSNWRPAGAVPAIPGLSLAHPAVLAPNGDTAHAGLLTGELPGGETIPLPARFVARMHALPSTEVVDLVETQAYRYSRLSVAGFAQTLTLYVLPDPAGRPAVLACYAGAGFSADMQACEQIVSTLRLVDQSHSYNLAPDPTYAARVSAAIGALNGQRSVLRAEMSRRATLATVQGLSTRLADVYANTAASLGALEEPSLVARKAQALLSGSLVEAREAYGALATAAGARSVSRYTAARAQVESAEANINTALESFALLGYEQGGSGG